MKFNCFTYERVTYSLFDYVSVPKAFANRLTEMTILYREAFLRK